MLPFEDVESEKDNWDYSIKLPVKDSLLSKETVKGSQFAKTIY